MLLLNFYCFPNCDLTNFSNLFIYSLSLALLQVSSRMGLSRNVAGAGFVVSFANFVNSFQIITAANAQCLSQVLYLFFFLVFNN